VEFCDKSQRRPKLSWGREFELRIPVHDVAGWTRAEVQASLRHVLEFLTGDRWRIEFVQRKKSEPSTEQGRFDLPLSGQLAVIPFSEGLDSRAVSGLMNTELGEGLIRVRLGTKSNDKPKGSSGRPLPFAAVPYGVSAGSRAFRESTARSRGFKFAMLSGIAAYLAKARRVIVPESGQGALGPTLVTVGQSYDDFRNHPAFTSKMETFINVLFGASIRFEFPRLWYTKGETLKEYAALPDSKDWSETRSCWQDNRHASVPGKRLQCGICAACMLRRLSVHAAGLSEPRTRYLWDDLSASSFAAAADKRQRKIAKVQEHYAIAGTLHLDHLAGLQRSPIYSYGLKTSAGLIARALEISTCEAEAKLSRLLVQHQIEWEAFVDDLGANSFIRNWIGTVK
jgi:hypothetical protein